MLSDPLLNQRNRGMDKVQQGKEFYNGNNDYDEKNKGYRLFLSGLDDLVAYRQKETNKSIVSQLTEFLKKQFEEADGMKNFLNSIKPQQQQQAPQQNFNQQQQNRGGNNNNNNNNYNNNNNNNQNNNNNHQQDNNNNNNNNNNGQMGNSKLPGQKNNGEDNETNKFQQALEQTIVSENPNVHWDDIAGLEMAKNALQEAVILPIKFPQIFEGQRTPWKGILLYGPPGTGKTYLAKACATECNATFFSISAADLISKWVGESEKMIKTLFKMAREKKPSIIFIDEVDSMAGSRDGGGGNESSTRVKTQFLVEMQGVGNDDRGVLVLGATNIPWGLDSAIRRRFEKRIYIALPEAPARKALLQNLLKKNKNSLGDNDIEYIAESTDGYSGADMNILIRDAAYEPLRKCQRAKKFKQMRSPIDGTFKWTPCSPSDPEGKEMNFMDINGPDLMLPEITIDDFITVLGKSRPSVGKEDLENQIKFTKEFGMEG